MTVDANSSPQIHHRSAGMGLARFCIRLSWYQSLQIQRISDSECLLVVVEIYIDMLQRAPPFADSLCPSLQDLRRVTALIFSEGTMQTNVRKIGRDLERSLKAGQLINTERGVVSAQYPVDGIAKPGRVPQL